MNQHRLIHLVIQVRSIHWENQLIHSGYLHHCQTGNQQSQLAIQLLMSRQAMRHHLDW